MDVTSRFELFWSEYPRKESKKRTREIFYKLNPDDALFEKIMKALQWQKKKPQWLKDYGQYIPMPCTWLNQERWDDEQPVRDRMNSYFDLMEEYEAHASEWN